MESGNEFFDMCDTRAGEAFNVLIVYDTLAAGQRAMRLCWDLASQQEEGVLSLQPRLWRLDLVADPVCGGFAIADAVSADLLIISTSGQSELSQAAQQWLRFCLARKRGTSAALVGLLHMENQQVNGAHFRSLDFLRSIAREAGLDFFVPKEGLDSFGAEPKPAEDASLCLHETSPLAPRQSAPAHQPAMLRAYGLDTNYREWGIND